MAQPDLADLYFECIVDVIIFHHEVKVWRDSGKPLFRIAFEKMPNPRFGRRTYKWYFKIMSFWTLWIARYEMAQPVGPELEEIRLTFNSLDLGASPETFAARCEAANYKTSVALDAIKELGIANMLTGENLLLYWDITMSDVSKTIKTLQSCNYR